MTGRNGAALPDDETLLWQGRPDGKPSLYPRPPSSVILLNGILVFAFAGPGLWALWTYDAPAAWLKGALLIGMLAVLAFGLNGLGGYALTRALADKYTRYYLTNRHAVIYVSLPLLPARTRIHKIDALMPLELDTRSSSVWFARRKNLFDMTDWHPTVIGTTPYGFDRIADAPMVYKRMRSIQLGEV